MLVLRFDPYPHKVSRLKNSCNNSPPDSNRLKEDMPALVAIMREFRVRHLLVNGPVEEDLKTKTLSGALRSACQSDPKMIISLPEIINLSKVPKSTKGISVTDTLYHGKDANSLAIRPAILLISFSPDMHISVSRLSHAAIIHECNAQIVQHRMLQSVQEQNSGNNANESLPTCRPLIACVRTFNGLGFLYSTLLGAHMGAATLILSPFDYFVNPQLWFDAVHKYRVKDAFATYPMLEHAMTAMNPVDYRSFSLNNLENLMIMTEGRLRPDICKVLI